MIVRSCFPELPGGGCWPQPTGTGYRGCFPGHEVRPVQRGRAPSNKRLLPSGANVLKEMAVVRLARHVRRPNPGAAGR